MKKKLTLLLIILCLSNIHSQDFELRTTPFIKSKILFKDGSSKDGLLRLASSVFKLRFKEKKDDKESKIDYELVEKIITNPNTENERTFQYLNHNYSRFKIFTELISQDFLSIYISLSDADELFYSDFDRQSIPEMMAQARFNNRTAHFNRLKSSDTLELPNGKKIALPIRYTYYYNLSYGSASGVSPTLSYHLLKHGDSVLYKSEKNKRFLKKASPLIENCPDIQLDLEENKITLGNLPMFIEYYKMTCGIEEKLNN